MRIRIPAGMAIAAGAALVVTACSSSGSDDSTSGTNGAGGGTSGGSSGSSSVVTVKVACSPTVQQIPRQLAADQGLDRKLGVNPECVQVQSGPAQSAALLSGDLNVAVTTPSLLVPLLDKQQPLVVFGRAWDVNNFDILVRKGVSLPHQGDGWQGVMQDLKGKKVGVVARGAAAESVARALFQEAGLSPDSATYIPTGLPNTTLAALQSNAIDAAITLEPGITLALEQGIATQPFSLAKGTGPKDMVYSDLLFVASREYAEKNKDALCKFNKAWDAGLDYVGDSANADAVDAAAAKFLGLKADQAKTLLENNASYYPDTTAPDAAKIDPGFAFAKKYGSAQKAYTMSDIGVDVCS